MTQIKIPRKSSGMTFFADLLSLFQTQSIKIPSDYRNQVLEVKKLLNNDTSGLVNTILDFAINCALVDYRIETSNENLTQTLNNWLKGINTELRGKIPTGLKPLAKEYFRERWKGSSHLLLRTMWEKNKDLDLFLPSVLYFVDGEDIKCEAKNEDSDSVELGSEVYKIRINDNKEDDINLPTKNEFIFVQKPYESWGTNYPTPFVIKRGLYRNLSFLSLMSSKGESIFGDALEYLMMIKKGTERMFLEGNETYDEEDLKQVKTDFADLLEKKKSEKGPPTLATNFDTEISHLIPEYEKAVASGLYSPIEKRLLAGLGIIEIVEGTASSRKESLLSPKPFISEVQQGIDDFKAMLGDIVAIIVEKNKNEHNKWMNTEINIRTGFIKEFLDKDFKDLLRSIYDRGNLSRKTLTEVVGECDYSFERRQREKEKKDGDDERMIAPIIQRNESNSDSNNPSKPNETTTPDKQGPEKRNYNQSAICKKCNEELSDIDIDFISSEDLLEKAMVVKKADGWYVLSKNGKNLGGPYKTKKEALDRLHQVEYYKNK